MKDYSYIPPASQSLVKSQNKLKRNDLNKKLNDTL